MISSFKVASIILALGCLIFYFPACGGKGPVGVNEADVERVLAEHPGRLPLGDGRLSDVPKRGYVMLCRAGFAGSLSAAGAHRAGEWIYSDGTWDPNAKTVEVDGDVAWDRYRYEISLDGAERKVSGNGLPSHRTGIFPIQPTDDAYQYDRNPNKIEEYGLSFSLPAMPALAERAGCLPMGAIGVMKSGVVIFNAFDADVRDAVAYEIQDKCNGHPEVDNRYHYHNLSKCIEDKSQGRHSDLVGYALDGFGIFGMYGENGKLLSNRDLDECHGHTHTILWDGKEVLMYHYHATKEFPYLLGCYRGTPAVRQ